MDVILIPGLWLDGSTWDLVVPGIEAAGHRAHALTLPGMESREADRSGVSLADHVGAVVAAIDACDAPVALVGHSAAAGLASIALDSRPDRVARALYIGGFPSGDGDRLVNGLQAADGEVPFPGWSAFGEEEVFDLDEAARAAFDARAIPSPERVVSEPAHLVDPRRYDVPVTVLCPEFTPEQLQEWIAAGEPSVQEFTRIRDLEYVDIPTGHWPQLSAPQLLADAIVAALAPRG